MKISVYVTSYNQKHYLIEAIESVLNQTLRPFEIIIVDDCSTDGSQEVIAGYASRYPGLIRPIYHTQNQGVAQTRTDALQAVSGDYVTYVDGDDRFLATKLEKEARLLEENLHAQIAFSNYYYIATDGGRTGVWADGEEPPQGNVFREVFARDFPRHNLFRNELVNYRAWQRIGFHDSNLCLYEDYEMRIRLTKQFKVAYLDEPLAEYRIHNGGLSHSNAAQYLAALEYIYRKNTSLLDDLAPTERWDVQRKLGKWIAGIARRAAREALDDGQGSLISREQAVKHYLRSLKYQPGYLDYRLVVRILMSYGVYNWLRAELDKIKGKT